MGSRRWLFFLTAIVLLFLAKAYIAGQFQHPIIFKDECIYGLRHASVMDISAYSIIPALFGRSGGILFNCLITSACIIPLFYLFRKHKGEREAALLAAITSFFSPLWVYATVNMTDGSFLFLVLLGALALEWCWATVFIKPLGLALPLAYMKEKGVYVALVAGIGVAVLNPVFHGFDNAALGLIRNVVYVILGSLTLALIPFKRINDGEGDRQDEFFVWYCLCTFALLATFIVLLPANGMNGRYFDGCVLLALTFAGKPFKKSREFTIVLIVLGFAALLFFALMPPNFYSGILDSALVPVWDATQSILYAATNPTLRNC